MQDNDLKALAKKVLIHHPDQQAVYVTSDGQCFFDQNAADSHQQRCGDRKEVLVVHRVLEEKLAEIKAKMAAKQAAEDPSTNPNAGGEPGAHIPEGTDPEAQAPTEEDAAKTAEDTPADPKPAAKKAAPRKRTTKAE